MTLTARVSHYWPPLGGPNCARFVRGQCLSATASGERFVCVDRGGKVVTNPDGVPWIDLLVQVAPVPYGTDVPVRVLFPDGP